SLRAWNVAQLHPPKRVTSKRGRPSFLPAKWLREPNGSSPEIDRGHPVPGGQVVASRNQSEKLSVTRRLRQTRLDRKHTKAKDQESKFWTGRFSKVNRIIPMLILSCMGPQKDPLSGGPEKRDPIR